MKDTGRRIKRVTMPDSGPNREIYFIIPGKGPRDCIEWEEINYGDHGEPYIMIYKDGVEVQRISPRYAVSIEWELPEITAITVEDIGYGEDERGQE